MKVAILSLMAIPALALPDRIQFTDSQGPMDPPMQVTVERTGYSGNGCPQGSVSTLISDDKTVVTFGFDSFQASIGPQVNPSLKQKNCQLHLGLRYPSGFQMSILDSTYHGYVRLDDGVTANFISSYYFSQDASHTATARSVLRGPEFAQGKTYTKSDRVETAAAIWSPCGANGILNVNNRIALTSSYQNGTGEISNDDATLKFTQKLRIAWQRCNSGDAGYDGNYPDSGAYRKADPPFSPYGYPPYTGSGPSYDSSYDGGSYSTFSNGGFGQVSDAPLSSSYGFPGVQVFGPGGRPLGGFGGSGTVTTINRPADSTVDVDGSSGPVVDTSISQQ